MTDEVITLIIWFTCAIWTSIYCLSITCHAVFFVSGSEVRSIVSHLVISYLIGFRSNWCTFSNTIVYSERFGGLVKVTN